MIKVIDETFRTETSHMIKVESGIEIIKEDIVGTEEMVDLD